MLANHLRLELHQIDIKGVLNNNEVMYMQHPPGYKPSDTTVRVLHLIKTLYGLKQAGQRWYQKLYSIFITLGFKRCSVDHTIFYKIDVCKGEIIITAVHIDNCTIAATCLRLIEELKASLHQHVEVTDLGELHWMLGIKIKRDRDARTIHLLQHMYIDAILRCYHFDELKPLSTPMDVQICLSSKQAPMSTAECVQMQNMPYCEAISALNWAALSTCPDITFAIATVAHFATNPGPAHWKAVKWIFCYLSGMQVPGDRLPLHHREQVHRSDAWWQGGNLAPIPHLRSVRASQGRNHSLLRQPGSHHAYM
jgi:hypothetical protein